MRYISYLSINLYCGPKYTVSPFALSDFSFFLKLDAHGRENVNAPVAEIVTLVGHYIEGYYSHSLNLRPSPLFICHTDRPTADPSILDIDYCFVWVCIFSSIEELYLLKHCRNTSIGEKNALFDTVTQPMRFSLRSPVLRC